MGLELMNHMESRVLALGVELRDMTIGPCMGDRLVGPFAQLHCVAQYIGGIYDQMQRVRQTAVLVLRVLVCSIAYRIVVTGVVAPYAIEQQRVAQ